MPSAESPPTSATIDIRRDELPSPLRESGSFTVLDTTEWFGETSGGIRTYLLQKSRYVAERRDLHQVIVVPGAHDSIADSKAVRMYRLRGPRIPGQAPYRLLLSKAKLERIIQHEQPDVIEVGSPFIVPWLVRRATRRSRIPIISYFHSNPAAMFADDSVSQKTIWQYMRALHRPFALTVASSAFSLAELTRAGIGPVVHIPLGVDLELFDPARRAHATDTRERLGIPEGPVAGFVGRFAAEKELVMLLEAWAAVDKATGARLVLVGAGPQEAALRVHRYGSRVTFIPFQSSRSSIADLVAAFDIYIAPGRAETFGLSSLEALASGTPLLAADRGGVAEQVERSGAGRTFAAGSSESLTEAAIALLQSDHVALGAAGRRYAVREHSWPVVLDRLFDVYRRVAEEDGRR